MKKCVSLLFLWLGLGCGATLPQVDRDLFAAAKADDAGEVERLVAAGANVNVKHDQFYDGLPPLGWAGGWGSAKTAEYLIAQGADVNARNRDGTTPLHVAAYHEQLALAALFIGHGADVNADRGRLDPALQGDGAARPGASDKYTA